MIFLNPGLLYNFPIHLISSFSFPTDSQITCILGRGKEVEESQTK